MQRGWLWLAVGVITQCAMSAANTYLRWDFREFMIMPMGAFTFAEALRRASTQDEELVRDRALAHSGASIRVWVLTHDGAPIRE